MRRTMLEVALQALQVNVAAVLTQLVLAGVEEGVKHVRYIEEADLFEGKEPRVKVV